MSEEPDLLSLAFLLMESFEHQTLFDPILVGAIYLPGLRQIIK